MNDNKFHDNNSAPDMQHVSSDDIAISIKNVSKYYKLYNSPKDRLKEALNPKGKIYHTKFYATKNLSLTIKKGEVIGIVGKNGSGKSTLLKLITGVLQPDEGSITVNGKISALLELGSGFNPEFTGMQNIFFYGVILGFTKEQMEKKLDDILAFADIGEFIHQPLKTYSSGMKSRLGFAVAVHIDPEILILDEVLAVGDVLFRRKCYAKMEELFKGGKTIIYVSHDANSIKQLCNRAIFLLDGKIVMDSDPKSVTQQYERFLFTKEEDKIKVKQELLNIHEKIEKPSLIKNKQHTSSHIVTQEKALLDENNYLPSLLSSPVYINKKFAILKDISIQNQKNKIVNVLKLKQLYTIKFKAIFPSDAKDVFVGAQILTMQGVLLSGSNTKHYKNEVFTVQKNEVLDVSINFTCLLLPDIYIIKIFAINAEESAFVDDAYIFKVENMPWAQGGNVHLYQDIQVKRYFNE